jgi:hypothetical protein
MLELRIPPEGYIIECYIREGVSLIMSVDRYVHAVTGESESRYRLQGRKKQFREAFETPGATQVARAVSLGLTPPPDMVSLTWFEPDLRRLEELLRTRILPVALQHSTTDLQEKVNQLAATLSRWIKSGLQPSFYRQGITLEDLARVQHARNN